MADGIVGQVQGRRDHVRIDAEQHDVLLPEHGSVIAVPDLARDREGRVAQLFRRRIGMVVHPVPHAHVDQRHPADLVRPPEIVERAESLRHLVRLGEAEELEVAVLEDECERLGERRVRHALQQRVVDPVHRERLLDVVTELVNGDVVALVIHPVRADARPEVRLVAGAPRAERMARAAGGIDLDHRGNVRRRLRIELQLPKDVRDVLRERLGGRVLPARDLVELLLGVRPARFEAVVPDVERLELPPQALLDELRDARDERRADDLLEHGADARLRQFAVFVEAARDERRRGRRIAIREPVRAVNIEQTGVAGVRLRRVRHLARQRGDGALVVIDDRRLRDLIRERVPVGPRVVDDDFGNGLRDDPLHDLLDRPLFREPPLSL